MPNRVAARFISGGKHQTFTSIAKSPFRVKTITNKNNRRQQYQAARRREARALAAAKRKAVRDAAAQKKAYARRAAELKKLAPKPPRKPRPKSPPIAVDPRTGQPITWPQAQKALREAQERAERLAAGLPGDAPVKAPRKTAAKKTAAARPANRSPAARRSGTARPRKPSKPRKATAIPAPPTSPGKTLTGVYWALTCACQGTGRIVQYADDGTPNGSISCPTHGRKARGGRKLTSRRAIKEAGLPGLGSWLEGKTRRGRGNLDKKQERARDRAKAIQRHAGPTTQCGACDEGIVNRGLTDQLRDAYIGDLIAKLEAQEKRIPPSRTLNAAARKAYPYDHCRRCAGLGRAPKAADGDWYESAGLKEKHRLTPREKAAGQIDPALRIRNSRTRRG